MDSDLNSILKILEAKSPKHAANVRESLSDLNDNLLAKSNSFLEKYSDYLKSENKTINFGINCYLQMIDDMQVEQLEFKRNGKYSSSSFDEVAERVYNNPETMLYHMHGLVLAQFLWYDQLERFSFFYKNLVRFAAHSKKYLEIGGGHGLYINEALELLPNVKQFDMVDISQTSLDLAKGIINSNKVKFTLKDIFKFNDEVTFDFITVGEVLEHLEDPIALLKKIAQLLSSDGICFITTPINAPMIDHIYLFNNADEIRNLFDLAGFEIVEEKIAISYNKSASYAEKHKPPVMFAAFVKLKNNPRLIR